MNVEANLDLFSGEFLRDESEMDGRIRGRKIDPRAVFEDFRGMVVSMQDDGTVTSGTAGETNNLILGRNTFEWYVVATQTILVPSVTATGLNIGMDQTDNDGIHLTTGITARSRGAYTVGDEACYLEVWVTPEDASGCDPFLVAFRKAAAYTADYNDYTDFAGIGIYAGDIKIESALNNAATVTTDTTDNASDATLLKLRVNVSVTGVVTYTINGAAPTTTATYTFDDGDVIVPTVIFLHGSDVAGTVNVSRWDCARTSVSGL